MLQSSYWRGEGNNRFIQAGAQVQGEGHYLGGLKTRELGVVVYTFNPSSQEA